MKKVILFSGGGLGPELIVNGDFNSSGSWNEGSNWSIGSGVASNTAVSFSNLIQFSVFEIGKIYKVTLDVSGGGGNLCRLYLGTSSGTAYNLINGKNEFIADAESTVITFRNFTNGAFNIDNVSAKEIL